MYKYELHCHTREVSKCSVYPAKELAKYYKENGYNGIVVTDHYALHTFFDGGMFDSSIRKDKFLRGYKLASEFADENFTVLPGMELRFWYNTNDYMVYGITEEFLDENRRLMAMGLKKFFELAEKNNLLAIQAHPAREVCFKADERYLHGAEIVNGKNKKNEIAEKWAREKGLKILTGGSDCHKEKGALLSGIITDIKIRTNDDLLRVLRSGEFEVIRK